MQIRQGETLCQIILKRLPLDVLMKMKRYIASYTMIAPHTRDRRFCQCPVRIRLFMQVMPDFTNSLTRTFLLSGVVS